MEDIMTNSETPKDLDFEQELYKHFGQVKDFTLGMQIGKYFYELGRQSKPKVCEGLEEEIDQVVEIFNQDYVEDGKGIQYGELNIFSDLRGIARHFAKWQKEQDDKELSEKIASAYQLGLADKEKQMMKEAVEGHILGEIRNQEEKPYEIYAESDFLPLNGKFKMGDKVKIIIVKED